ncbi:30S ribosomal protein S30 [Marinitoga sp. 1135]|uniref:Ribosome hibernation promoting factor n=1 Tax=Marinitoga piezophila (strain DSM 14283 / JCM 11233 / KA3) TaxID=443254 RepID=H2J445_MARPK|nr:MULTISPECIES: ribosome-associated translation inhibitor RaiA [Marinitoga]AEX85860.1 ribosomal subunit interface protein [Marinitoga piezophila KA3]APT76297.1 30S ribosomal protein S30 [Marinitoga sp. 1137]NUU96062.1 30S ribosomal protein S30 [Marinitoga sp. 1135]NUU97973.1 30S ribosomal protein S30 [Marinitoga sp. 1138]
MDYKLFTKNIELTKALEDYLEKRMEKIDRMFKKHDDLLMGTEIRVEKDRETYKVEVTSHLKFKGSIFKVEERGTDLYEVIDKVSDAFERKLKKVKGKLQNHDAPNPLKDVKPVELDDEDELFSKIEKRKRFDMSMFSLEEAILQLELLGHEFFVFRNSESEEVNVIYKRKDGTLGLIEFEE